MHRLTVFTRLGYRICTAVHDLLVVLKILQKNTSCTPPELMVGDVQYPTFLLNGDFVHNLEW